jgi:hypothetical protein
MCSKRRNTGLVLQCLQEECAEVIQIASKISRFGAYSRNPEDPNSLSNIELLHQEIGDVYAVLEVLKNQTVLTIDDELIEKMKQKKLEKLEIYLPYICEEDNKRRE